MWKKFKRWLIIKLGGFVEEPEKVYNKRIMVSEENRKIVPITAEIITEFYPCQPWDIQYVHKELSDAIMNEIFEGGFVDVKTIHGETKPGVQEYVTSARIFVEGRRYG